MYARILVPVDVAHIDKLSKALDSAAHIAKENDATVVYFGVVDSVPTPSAVTEGDRMTAALGDFAERQSKHHGIKVEERVALRKDLHLHVGSEIIEAAKTTGSDLIVMASHIPGIKDHFFSSNAGYVATHAPMSVYVIR
ncbi:MAG: universal stress protein [Dinoroseobacter sp.]|nr:universal stress protein [Dinoroseobacter sp.]